MAKDRWFAVDALLKPYATGERTRALELLCEKYAEHTGKQASPGNLPESWFADRDTAQLFEVALAILKEYHPDLSRERQKRWTGAGKFFLVEAVEALHAVGYGKREACKLLAPEDSSMYRRYAKFKKEINWIDHTGDERLENARFHVQEILKLPLPE